MSKFKVWSGLRKKKQVFLRTFSAPCLNLPPRKANNLFEKNAAPILHLAGVEITIVKVCRFLSLSIHFLESLGSPILWHHEWYILPAPLQTDYEGQAKKLMEFMEKTDMLIVAGGDGTLQEVITGLLRRPDQVGGTQASCFGLMVTDLNVSFNKDDLWLQETLSNTPIGFIPLGSHNSLSPSLHLLSDNKVK